jgi:SSS family solute:Na+ symporter
MDGQRAAGAAPGGSELRGPGEVYGLGMHPLDLAAVAAYFLVIAGIGVWCAQRNKGSSEDYFLAGHGVGWAAIGASLFASNISAEHFLGLAGSGASSGLAVGQFEWLACLILILLGWLFVPFYLRTGVFTMPEFLERRFSPGCRLYLSAVSLVAYVFTKVSVAVYAGALVLETVLGWDKWVGATALLLATGAYTVFGGLMAVIYTDFVQAFVLLGGAAALTWLAVAKVGGVSVLVAQLDPSFFTVWHPVDHPEFPWTGLLFGAPILGIWYWCTDQMIVQRTLAARGVADARKATVFAGYLKLLPVFLLVAPGMAGRILYPDVAPDRLYAAMVHGLLPPGLKGLVVAGLLAALMSSLSSVFNSASTLVVMDFYRRWYPDAEEARLVRIGQLSTLVLVGVGLAWLPLVEAMSTQLYIYLQSVQAYISPPIAVVFLGGVLWRGANAQGALATLLVGAVLGAVRFGAEVVVKTKGLVEGPLHQLAAVNFLHFAVALAIVSLVILVVVSRATGGPTKEALSIFEDAGDVEVDGGPSGAAALLVLVVLVLWVVFSPLGIGA